MNSKDYFSTEKNKQVSTFVFEQLRDAIFRGKFSPGERILPERELATIMNVSRTSVRNAITRLITLGYLENHQGKGTFVAAKDSVGGRNPFINLINPQLSTIDELLEYRIGFGSHGVSLAAERATDHDIEYLEEVLSRSEGEQWTPEKETETDIAFHMGIAYATHNSVYIDLTRRFYEYMFLRLKDAHSLIYENQARRAEIERQHHQILICIKNHDAAGAREAMQFHIEQLRALLREEFERAE